MLESVLKAYLKGTFEMAEFDFPVRLQTIKQYLKTLTGLYEISIGFQRSNSSISEVIPSIVREVYVLERIPS